MDIGISKKIAEAVINTALSKGRDFAKIFVKIPFVTIFPW